MIFSKLFSLLSNFLPFGIYILIESLIVKNSWWLRGFLIFLVFTQLLAGILLYFIVKKESKKYPKSENEYKIIRITRDRTSSLNFVITNIFPLIAFDFNNIGLMVFSGIMIIIIAVLFCKNNLYLYNPILEITGFKIFNIEMEKINCDKGIKETTRNVVSKTLVTSEAIPLNDTLKLREFEDDICFNL